MTMNEIYVGFTTLKDSTVGDQRRCGTHGNRPEWLACVPSFLNRTLSIWFIDMVYAHRVGQLSLFALSTVLGAL